MVSYRKGDMKINTKTHVDDITLVVENNGCVIELMKYAKTAVTGGLNFYLERTRRMSTLEKCKYRIRW